MGKLQHYVPRSYLRAWAKRDKLYCLQSGDVRWDNIRNLAAENYFYKLRELSREDVEFLRKFVSDSPAGLKGSHERLINAFTLPHRAKRKLETLGHANPQYMIEIDQMIVELNEGLHTSIENDFRQYLKAMMSGSLDFLENTKDAAAFYGGLTLQYTRTNHIKKMRLVMDPERFELYKRLANLLIHIIATNAGWSLFADRKSYTARLLDNATTVPFITADQPVINIAASPKETTPPARFDLYYPVSPTKALILVGPSSDLLPRDSSVSEEAVEMYNVRMAAHSYRQVFSDSQDTLARVRDALPAYLSCFP
jgi:hypothetical protein